MPVFVLFNKDDEFLDIIKQYGARYLGQWSSYPSKWRQMKEAGELVLGKDARQRLYKIGAFVKSQDYVTNSLRAPGTAKFPWYSESYVRYYGNGKYVVHSYVDAENAFGGQVRTRYTCTLHADEKGAWMLDDLQLHE